MMVYSSYQFWRRHSIRAFHPYAMALGLLALSSEWAIAQPPDPPTPRARAEQRMQKMREEMEARQRAPRPPVVQSRVLSPDGKMAVSYSSEGKFFLWDTSTSKDLRTLEAYDAAPHSGFFRAATFSPNGKLLFTLGQIKQKVEPGATAQIVTVDTTGTRTETTQGKLWDVTTGKLLWTLPQMNDGLKWSTAVNTVAFSADSKVIATKARYGPIHLWDTATCQLLRTLPVPFINMDALAFSPDGKILAGGGYRSFQSHQGEILLWDVESGALERSLMQPDDALGTEIRTIAFSPNGKLLATGGGRGQYERINEISGRFNTHYGMAQLWDVKSGVLLTSLGQPVHRDLVTTLAFSPDGARLATGSMDHTVGLWDTRIGELLGSATRYGTENRGISTGVGVRDLVFSGDGKTLNMLSGDKTVRAWDVAAPSPPSDPLRHIIPSSDSSYSSFAFGPNGRWLVSGEYRKQVRFWTTDKQQETQSFIAHDDPIVDVAIAPFAADEYRHSDKDPLLATGSNLLEWKKTGENSASGYVTGFEVKLWNSQTHELRRTLSMPGFSLTALTVSPGGQWIAAAGGRIGPLPAGTNMGNGGFAVAVGGPEDALNPPDVKQDVAGIVMLWNAATGELKQKFSVVGDIPTDLAFSPDGRILASDGNEAGVTLWQTVTGVVIRTLDEDRPPALKPGERRMSVRIGTPKSIPTLAFTGDSTTIARSRKGQVKLWNVETGVLTGTLSDPENTTQMSSTLIALTPDGKTLATAGPHLPLKLWDVATGRLLCRSPEEGGISMMELAPNGKTLATNTRTGGIRLWDISQAKQGTLN